MDNYIDEFLRLGRTGDVSENFKMIKFRKGLRSNQLKELLKTKSYDSLESLMDAARMFNPRDAGHDTAKATPSFSSKKTPVTQRTKAAEPKKCTTSHCTEKGHSKDKCWMMNADLRPAWFKDVNKRSGASAASAKITEVNNASDSEKMWSVLAAIQTDLAKIKADLN